MMPVYPFSLNVILNIYNMVISFANRGISLTLFTGDGTSVKSRSRVLSNCVLVYIYDLS